MILEYVLMIGSLLFLLLLVRRVCVGSLIPSMKLPCAWSLVFMGRRLGALQNSFAWESANPKRGP